MIYKRGFVDGEYQDGEIRGLVFAAGKRGMGKTTEMARMLRACSGGVLFFDTLSKHGDVLRGWTVITQPGQLKAYLRVNAKKRFRILYQPTGGDLDAHFDAVCKIVRAFGEMVFAVDELDNLCGPRFGDSRMCKGFYDLVNYGRHYRVATMATARAPMQVPRGFTSNCFEMRLFKITEEDHIDYFRKLIGKENAARLARLPKFHFLHWQDGLDAAPVRSNPL